MSDTSIIALAHIEQRLEYLRRSKITSAMARSEELEMLREVLRNANNLAQLAQKANEPTIAFEGVKPK